jgi:hypothetical protein
LAWNYGVKLALCLAQLVKDSESAGRALPEPCAAQVGPVMDLVFALMGRPPPSLPADTLAQVGLAHQAAVQVLQAQRGGVPDERQLMEQLVQVRQQQAQQLAALQQQRGEQRGRQGEASNSPAAAAAARSPGAAKPRRACAACGKQRGTLGVKLRPCNGCSPPLAIYYCNVSPLGMGAGRRVRGRVAFVFAPVLHV